MSQPSPTQTPAYRIEAALSTCLLILPPLLYTLMISLWPDTQDLLAQTTLVILPFNLCLLLIHKKLIQILSSQPGFSQQRFTWVHLALQLTLPILTIALTCALRPVYLPLGIALSISLYAVNSIAFDLSALSIGMVSNKRMA